MNRIPSLDGLRALSILLVVFGHLGGTQGFLKERFFYDDGADFGVRIFFVISGYLITLLILRERQETGRISLKHFYLRRAFRILPAAYFYILTIAIFDHGDITHHELLASFLFLANFTHVRWTLVHLWSLSVEEQFYLLWPAILVLAYRHRTKISIGTIALAPILRAIFYLHGWVNVNHYFPTVADSIATGCLLATLTPYLCRWAFIFSSRWCVIFPTAAAGTLLVDYWNRKVYNAVGLTVLHVCIALSIYAATKRSGGVLNWGPVVWLGRASYSIYLWQMPFCDRYSHGWWSVFPTSLLLTMACGCLSFYVVERPALNLRRRFESQRLLCPPNLQADADLTALDSSLRRVPGATPAVTQR